LVLVGLEGG